MLSRLEHNHLQHTATTRAAHLNRLFALYERGVDDAQQRSIAGPTLVDAGAAVTAPARGAERVGIVVQAIHDMVTLDYLTANALSCAAAETGRCAPLGTNSVTYATEAAIRARMEAEKKLLTWRRWVTTDPRLLQDNDSAREVWNRISPELELGREPAVSAQLARREAAKNLETYQRSSWPNEVYKRAYADAYIRDRVSRLCRLAPHLAWTRVRRATAPRSRVRVVG